MPGKTGAWRRWALGVVVLLPWLTGCELLPWTNPSDDLAAAPPAVPVEPPATAPADAPAEEPVTEPVEEPAEAPAEEPATDSAEEPVEERAEAPATKPNEEPTKAPQVIQPKPEPEPKDSAAEPEGVLINLRDDMRVLAPTGWEQRDSDAGTLRLRRREPLDGTAIELAVSPFRLPAEAREMPLSQLRQELINDLGRRLARYQFKASDSQTLTVAGQPALAVRGELRRDGQPLRVKLVVVRDQERAWQFLIIAPRTGFAGTLEPEFDRIVASLELS